MLRSYLGIICSFVRAHRVSQMIVTNVLVERASSSLKNLCNCQFDKTRRDPDVSSDTTSYVFLPFLFTQQTRNLHRSDVVSRLVNNIAEEHMDNRTRTA